VILKHPGGYQTYYGHLSKIHERLRQGTEVSQGSLIGLVGSTGLATGPHLHFEMRINARPINPLSSSVPRGSDITVKSTVKFERLKAEQDVELASIPPGNFLAIEGKRHGNPGSSEG